MKYKLHYANLELDSDIPCYKFNLKEELQGFILAESELDSVYLVSIFNEVFVTSNMLPLLWFIDKFTTTEEVQHNKEIEIFIQEYESFEEAYIVALDMQEIKPNCYSEETKNNA